jgi:hypothetical protein
MCVGVGEEGMGNGMPAPQVVCEPAHQHLAPGLEQRIRQGNQQCADKVSNKAGVAQRSRQGPLRAHP